MDEKNTLRIVSYNIRNGNGMDGKSDLNRIADAINRLTPNLVALQEIDSMANRTGQRDILRDLAEKTLMHRLYAPAIDFDGGKYGVGILSKEKPQRSEYLPLPGREEQRVLLIAEFDRYILACTHLSLTEEDRMASLAIIRDKAEKASKPFILAGDLNARPQSSFITALTEDFTLLSDTAKHTFPASEPTGCIDYIAYYNPGTDFISRLATFVADEPLASDHRPIVSDIRICVKAEEIFSSKPYLQNPVGEGITVMWQTHVPTYSWVEYGTDTLNLQKTHTLVDGQVICNDYYNKIRLSRLQPGQKYYYRVCSREITLYQAYKKEFGETAVSPFYSFSLPDANTTDFTAIIFNDLHKQEATLNALYNQVKDIPYNFVVFNGDCIDDPKTEEDALLHLTMQCTRVGAENVPVFYLRGNHEIRDAYSIGLRELFDYVGDKTYGAFNWGDTRFVMLDCGEDKPDTTWVYYGLNDFTQLRLDQVRFLTEELSTPAFSNATKRVLLNHIPLYGAADAYSPCRELWGGLLANAPFDINISAHTHRHAYHPKGSAGNNFPVVIGGNQRMEGSTVMVLQKEGKAMTLRVLDTKGDTIYQLNL
ncbi:metallophosphoesterase [Parabacteroides sp. OttesenSCG-928-G07]|nr:metallophosphoesterase [Parabacteroides sp. OttesenSCG-928-G21]MDL2278488.1 metallophosphoesterase [Parabacteroides sp. OttesenSCG-928-G07]